MHKLADKYIAFRRRLAEGKRFALPKLESSLNGIVITHQESMTIDFFICLETHTPSQ